MGVDGPAPAVGDQAAVAPGVLPGQLDDVERAVVEQNLALVDGQCLTCRCESVVQQRSSVVSGVHACLPLLIHVIFSTGCPP